MKVSVVPHSHQHLVLSFFSFSNFGRCVGNIFVLIYISVMTNDVELFYMYWRIIYPFTYFFHFKICFFSLFIKLEVIFVYRAYWSFVKYMFMSILLVYLDKQKFRYYMFYFISFIVLVFMFKSIVHLK